MNYQENDGSRREAVDGMPPPVPTVHCCVRYPARLSKGSVRGEVRGVCVASNRGIKILWERLPEGGVTEGTGAGRVVWGP